MCDLVNYAGVVVQHNSLHGTVSLAAETTALASEAAVAGGTVRGRIVLNGESVKTNDGWIVKPVNCPMDVSATWSTVPEPFCID